LVQPQPKRRLLTRLLLLVAIVLLPVLGCLAPFAILTIPSNIAAWRFEQTIYDYPLPPSTEVVSRTTRFGLLEGNGNHCDISPTQLLRTPLTVSEVKAHYNSPALIVALEEIRGGRSVSVGAEVTDNAQADGVALVRVEFFSHGQVFQGMEQFDPRCH
jgi:hypothetical protein